jgi:hypothetical protein
MIPFLIGAYAVVGIACVIAAWYQLSDELKQLNRLSSTLDVSTLWDPIYRMSAKAWLKESSIPAASHAGILLVALRGGWVGGKLPTMGELHSMALRKERTRPLVRAANGIAATLLIIGIAATLWGIHPLLTEFKIDVGSDGTVPEASANADAVMNLVRHLGEAFVPSLVALCGTVAVVLARGIYVHRANLLIRAVDLFAADELVPRFRLKTQAEVIEGLNSRLESLATRLEKRDSGFGKAVTALVDVANSLQSLTPDLDASIKALSAASDKISSGSDSMVQALDRNFGSDSPVSKSLVLIEDLSDKVSGNFVRLSNLTTEYRDAASAAAKSLAKSAKGLETSSANIAKDAGVQVEEASTALHEARTTIATAIASIMRSLELTAEGVVRDVSSTIAEAKTSLSEAALAASDQAIAKTQQDQSNRAALLEANTEILLQKRSREFSDQIKGNMDAALDRIDPVISRLEHLIPALSSQTTEPPAVVESEDVPEPSPLS